MNVCKLPVRFRKLHKRHPLKSCLGRQTGQSRPHMLVKIKLTTWFRWWKVTFFYLEVWFIFFSSTSSVLLSSNRLIPALLFQHSNKPSSLMNTRAAFFQVQLSRVACSLVLFMPRRVCFPHRSHSPRDTQPCMWQTQVFLRLVANAIQKFQATFH